MLAMKYAEEQANFSSYIRVSHLVWKTYKHECDYLSNILMYRSLYSGLVFGRIIFIVFFTFVPCILILSKFVIHQRMHK